MQALSVANIKYKKENIGISEVRSAFTTHRESLSKISTHLYGCMPGEQAGIKIKIIEFENYN